MNKNLVSYILSLTTKSGYSGVSMSTMQAFSDVPQERLLRALAEQLKLPLLQIARTAEFAQSNPDTNPEHLGDISYTADMALRLIDGYLLSVQMQSLPNLELEPVSLSAVLQDTAHRLSLLAQQYGCDVELNLAGKYEPVMANREALEAAYTSLGYAFIEALPAKDARHIVTLAVHRSNQGIVAGVYGDHPAWGSDVFKRGRALYGQARQALPVLSASSGAGVFIADALFDTMASPLRMARHHKLNGLAATLAPSKQLQLV